MDLHVISDGISDGKEYLACRDTDGDTHPDANDTDSDGDGIPDNLEDSNLNGRWDAGETDAKFNDTDLDGLLDGTEDADHDGVRDGTETSPIDKDTDDDGIADKAELDGTWCYVWETSATCGPTAGRITNPLNTDTDGDGLLDGQEIGLTSAGVSTLVSVFRADTDPSSTTNPNATDTDADGLSDRYEDMNLNGRVDSGEPNPKVWDTDGDGLCDGNCSGQGEDKNLNGIRDQDADGNYTETDFLANDSDVDGVSDGAEVNGTYCFKGGSCANTAHPLLPLNPDTDGDGLRDGQELAGWMVGVWYERTMEKKENYSVTSDPWATNGDADALTDFEEFMNGSNPRSNDTDGDRINDTAEIARHSNITGVEGTPPVIENVTVSIALALRSYQACALGLCLTLYLPDHLELHVAFDVSDAVGVDRVTLRVTKLSGVETRTFELGGALTKHFDEAFAFGLLEALATGADVNITAYDVNGNGAWGQFHQDSVVEAVAKAVVALFSAIAKVIVEAASAAIDWIWGAVSAAMNAVIQMILDAAQSWVNAILAAFAALSSPLETGANDAVGDVAALMKAIFLHPFALAIAGIAILIVVFGLIISPFLLAIPGISIALQLLVAGILIAIVAAGAVSLMAKSMELPSSPSALTDWLVSGLDGFKPTLDTQPISRMTPDQMYILKAIFKALAVAITVMLWALIPVDALEGWVMLGVLLFLAGFVVSLFIWATAPHPPLNKPLFGHDALRALGIILALAGFFTAIRGAAGAVARVDTQARPGILILAVVQLIMAPVFLVVALF